MTLQTGSSLTVREVAAHWQAWTGALAAAEAGPVLLDTTGLESVDTAGVQLVLALRRECHRQAREFACEPADTPALLAACERLALTL